jgi:hypothetical protein
MAERVRVREISNQEGNRLLRIVRPDRSRQAQPDTSGDSSGASVMSRWNMPGTCT